MPNFLKLLSRAYTPFKPQSKHSLNVSFQADMVTIDFGNGLDVTTHYRDAIKIANLIFHIARQCKREAGDTGMNFNVLGTLTDAEANDKLRPSMY